MTILRLPESLEFELELEPIEGVSIDDIVEALEAGAAYVEVADTSLTVIDKYMEFYFYNSSGEPLIADEDNDEMICGSLIGEARNVDSEQNCIYRTMRTLELVGEVESVSFDDEVLTVSISNFPVRTGTLAY